MSIRPGDIVAIALHCHEWRTTRWEYLGPQQALPHDRGGHLLRLVWDVDQRRCTCTEDPEPILLRLTNRQFKTLARKEENDRDGTENRPQ